MHSPLFADHSSRAFEQRLGGVFPPTVSSVELDSGRLALYWGGVGILTLVGVLLVHAKPVEQVRPQRKLAK
jgi:hypothetical protein